MYSCSDSKDSKFVLDSSLPVEVGIESLEVSVDGNAVINVYMINHNPVSGIQFQITPDNFFAIDSVFGGRAEDNDFALYSNKKGKILGFSMKGSHIPPSNSNNKKENLLFSAIATSLIEINAPIQIEPIIADKDAKKMDFISLPFSK